LRRPFPPAGFRGALGFCIMDVIRSEGDIIMFPTFIIPLFCIRSIMGITAGAEGFLDVLFFATRLSFHRSAGTPLRR